MPACKPWQYGDMNLYRAIRNCMWYWGARMILEKGANESLALACHVHPQERLAVARNTSKRRYWRFRRSGMSSAAAMGAMHGQSEAEILAGRRRRKARMIAKWGGDPVIGTDAFNRWAMARL
jgi:hypothetical protein